jgi:OOP family OmpA-OmpF porin
MMNYPILCSAFKFFILSGLLFSIKSIANTNTQDVAEQKYIYFGARAGYTYNEKSCMDSAFNCDHTDIGYGIFSGYQFNRSVALELSFNDLGDSIAEYPNIQLKGKSRETDLALKLSHNLNDKTQLYAKLGAAYWDGKVTGQQPVLEHSDMRWLLGAGVEYSLSSRWSARFEYQYIHQIGNNEMGFANPHLASLGLMWKLPTQKTIASVAPPPVLPALPPPLPPPPEPERRIVVSEEHGGPLFDFNKSEIRHTDAINQVVDILQENQDLNVTIIGHTDSRGTAEYNQALSETRARAVAKYLHYKGVSLDRIKVFGMGEDQPVADNETDPGRAKNRRVEFVISAIKKIP